jgi:hypothetical protein
MIIILKRVHKQWTAIHCVCARRLVWKIPEPIEEIIINSDIRTGDIRLNTNSVGSVVTQNIVPNEDILRADVGNIDASI